MEFQHHGRIKNGTIISTSNLRIKDFNVVDELKNILKFQNIILNHDGRCAAICEKMYGNLKEYDDCIFMCLGTGIGGAVFLNGEVLNLNDYNNVEFRTYDNRKKWKKMLLWEKWMF